MPLSPSLDLDQRPRGVVRRTAERTGLRDAPRRALPVRRAREEKGLRGAWAVFILALLVAGCGRPAVRSYEVPKEPSGMEAAQNRRGAAPGLPVASQDAGMGPAPVRWTVPPGWEAQPAGGMRVGSFLVTGKEGRQADVSVIPLGGMPENELANVNRWREQVGLPAIQADALAAQADKVSIGSAPGDLFDVVSVAPLIDGKYRKRILAAMLTRGDTTWFFKMTGDDATVGAAKPAFLRFLRSLEFAPVAGLNSAAEQPVSTNVRTIPASPGKPTWNIPADWQSEGPSLMVLANYAVRDKGGGQARVSISSFPGDVGGPLANVNRWRNQLGLPPVDDAGLGRVAHELDVLGGEAVLVDLTGTDVKTGKASRMIAAMVPRTQETWFYKLMGDPSVVKAEREPFLRFVQTVRYPHG